MPRENSENNNDDLRPKSSFKDKAEKVDKSKRNIVSFKSNFLVIYY